MNLGQAVLPSFSYISPKTCGFGQLCSLEIKIEDFDFHQGNFCFSAPLDIIFQRSDCFKQPQRGFTLPHACESRK